MLDLFWVQGILSTVEHTKVNQCVARPIPAKSARSSGLKARTGNVQVPQEMVKRLEESFGERYSVQKGLKIERKTQTPIACSKIHDIAIPCAIIFGKNFSGSRKTRFLGRIFREIAADIQPVNRSQLMSCGVWSAPPRSRSKVICPGS